MSQSVIIEPWEVVAFFAAIFATMRAWKTWDEPLDSVWWTAADLVFWLIVAAVAWSALR